MAKTKTKKPAPVEVEETDDEELEDIEDLEELADSEAEDDSDDEEEDEDEPKKKKSSTKKKAKKKESEGIGTAELAEALDTDGRNLRVMLRQKKANETPRFKENARYHWDSVDQALEELGFDDADEAKAALKESRDERLEELKNRPKAEKKSTKAKAKKKKAAEPEEDEDEDEDDE